MTKLLPIAYRDSAGQLICPPCDVLELQPQYGSCVTYKCAHCGEPIPANRKPGRKGYKELTRNQS